jgi:hypothetical protein
MVYCKEKVATLLIRLQITALLVRDDCKNKHKPHKLQATP